MKTRSPTGESSISSSASDARLRENHSMRVVGRKMLEAIGALPTSAALAAAAVHQATGQRLAAVSSTGIAKGVYRFATHEEMNRRTEESLARVVAANARVRGER